MRRSSIVWIIVLILALILGVILLTGAGNERDDDMFDNENDNGTEINDDTSGDISGSVLAENAININTQRPGNSATASFVMIGNPGFVVIHEGNPTGNPGRVVGVSPLLAAGQTNNVAIPLTANLAEDKTYTAMLYTDNGDGVFTLGSDPAAMDSRGNQITMGFEVDADASVDTSISP